MSLKEKIEDAKLFIKRDRRAWVGLGLIVIVLLVFSATPGKKKPNRAKGFEMEASSAPAEAGQTAYQDLIVSLQGQVNDMNTNLRDNLNVSDRFKKELEQQKEKTEGVIEMMVERMESMDEKLKEMEVAQQHIGQATTTNASDQSQGQDQSATVGVDDQLSSFGWEAKPNLPPKPQPPIIEKRRFISPGDSVPVKLLTGVAAPTDGTPYPVVFKLNGEITGPDGSALDLGEARIIAAAVGSETDARVIFRLTQMAFRHPDGRRSVVKVDGWVVGEDGVRGMTGQVIDKLGQVIAATAGYSFVAALGENVNRQRNNQFQQLFSGRTGIGVTGDDMTGAAASAMTDASNRLGQLLVDKYERLIPVVEVKSGREVAIVFASGAEVDVMDENDSGEGIYAASEALN